MHQNFKNIFFCFINLDFYFRFNYTELLANSTFCLIPRGRRLASFRFLEAIQYGCIPVIMSNGWDLPFSDVIDWVKFSIVLDESLLLQLPNILRGIKLDHVLSMKQQTIFVWKNYFSSVSQVIHTTLEVSFWHFYLKFFCCFYYICKRFMFCFVIKNLSSETNDFYSSNSKAPKLFKVKFLK